MPVRFLCTNVWRVISKGFVVPGLIVSQVNVLLWSYSRLFLLLLPCAVILEDAVFFFFFVCLFVFFVLASRLTSSSVVCRSSVSVCQILHCLFWRLVVDGLWCDLIWNVRYTLFALTVILVLRHVESHLRCPTLVAHCHRPLKPLLLDLCIRNNSFCSSPVQAHLWFCLTNKILFLPWSLALSLLQSFNCTPVNQC